MLLLLFKTLQLLFLHSSKGTSQEVISSSENSYGSQPEDRTLKKAKPLTSAKKKPVGRPKLSKTPNKVQEKAPPKKKKAPLEEKDNATSVVKRKNTEKKAKLKKSSPGDTSNPCKENPGKEEVEKLGDYLRNYFVYVYTVFDLRKDIINI